MIEEDRPKFSEPAGAFECGIGFRNLCRKIDRRIGIFMNVRPQKSEFAFESLDILPMLDPLVDGENRLDLHEDQPKHIVSSANLTNPCPGQENIDVGINCFVWKERKPALDRQPAIMDERVLREFGGSR